MKFRDNSCLMLIDFQNDYNNVYHLHNLCENVSKLLRKARRENILICFIFNVDHKVKSRWLTFSQEMRGPIKLDEGIPMDCCIPQKNEKVIVKYGFDCFFETSLNSFLNKNKIESLYVCGCLTSVCVLNTMFSAFNHGYRIHLIENACSDRKKKNHNHVIESYENYLFIKETI